MFISGSGLIYSNGRGISTLTNDLEQGPSEPEFLTIPMIEEPFPVFRIKSEVLQDRILPRSMRRADRFSRIVTLAALDSIEQSGRELSNPDRTGILFATSLGPHTTSFDFLDEILEYGDTGSSPTKFTHSVHNIAVSYIAQALNITGPTSTIAQFQNSFVEVLRLAKAWLTTGRCDQVLVGAGEEFGNVLAYILSRKLEISRTGQIDPFENNGYVPGEGVVFFLLSKSPMNENDLVIDIESWNDKSDLYLVNAEQTSQDIPDTLPALCYTPIFGHTFASTAFHTAIATAIIKEQKIFQDKRFGSAAMQENQIANQSLNTIACRQYPDQDGLQVIIRKQK